MHRSKGSATLKINGRDIEQTEPPVEIIDDADCCSPSAKRSCCDSEDKAECCAGDGEGSCGCR